MRLCSRKDCTSKARPRRKLCDEHSRKLSRARPSRSARVIYLALSDAEWVQLFEQQFGLCSICTRPIINRYAAGEGGEVQVGEVAYLDHDHKAEKAGIAAGLGEREALRRSLRGLLCYHCNRNVLHALRDRAEIAEGAARYLRNPPARSMLGV